MYGIDCHREWCNEKVIQLFRRPSVLSEGRKLLWFRNHVPRFSFITWIVMLNKLPTTDRLNAWGMNVNGTCVLCGVHQESRNHLFFECKYVSVIWREGVKRTFTLLATTKWDEIFEFLKQHVNYRDLRRQVLRLF